jgi:outer membrane protein X
MKKLFLTMLVVLMSVSAIAQDKKYGVGINLLYGTKIKSLGFGVKGQYYATEAIRLEANADYFMKNNKFDDVEDYDMKMWDVNVVGHYLIPVAESMKVYPLAGVGITNWVHSAISTKTKFAVNLGGGFQFDVAEDFALSAEAKYQIIDKWGDVSLGQAVFAIGAVYKF